MSAAVLIEAVEVEGFGEGGVVAPAFGDVQVAGVFDGRDDSGAYGGQVGGPAAGTAGGGVAGQCARAHERCSSERLDQRHERRPVHGDHGRNVQYAEGCGSFGVSAREGV